VADVVAELLEAVARAEEHRGKVAQLEHALTTRVLVEQAKGVLMAQTDLAEGEAFEQLRRTARASRLTVAEVARTVLANRHGPAGRDADGGAALERLTRLAVTRMPARELLTAILEPVAALAGADVAAVLVPADREGELEGFARAPRAGRVRPLRIPAVAGLAGQVLADGTPRLIPQAVRPDPAFPGVPVRSAAAVPLAFGGQPFGALLVARTGGQPLTPAELHRLQLAAARVGPAAIGARLDELQAAGRATERAALDRLRRLQAVTAALSGALTPAEVATVVAEEGVRALRAVGGVVAVATADGGLEVLAAAGYDDRVIARHRQLPATSELPLAVAVREGQAIWLGSAADHERFPATRGLRTNEATASVPLVVHGRCLGVLGLSFSVRQAFDEDARLFITTLADQCAQALERARLYEAAGKERLDAVAERDRLAYVAEASALLAGSLDPKVTLDQIAWLAIPRLADYCVVLLVEGGLLRPAAVAARDEATREILGQLSAAYPIPASAEGPLAELRRTGRALLHQATSGEILIGMAADDEHLRLLRALETTSALTVPLSGRADWFGVIAFSRQAGGGPPYGEVDRTLAEDLARRVGLALDTARRFEALNHPPRDDTTEEPAS
jgi:GAF domain-containing protein